MIPPIKVSSESALNFSITLTRMANEFKTPSNCTLEERRAMQDV